jgi:hypothetical protein
MKKFDEDEYRAHAAECQRMADASVQEADRRQWLSLAQSWLGLIRTPERTPTDTFDAETRTKGADHRPDAGRGG